MNEKRTYLHFASLLVFGILFALNVKAQAPYSGGAGEGQAAAIVVNNLCPAVAANPFGGGEGGGFSSKVEQNEICEPERFNIYEGGTGGGFVQTTLVEEVCTPLVYNIFEGGDGGGYASNLLQAEVCYSIKINPFSGGDGGGYSRMTLTAVSCESVRINPFEGGVGGGFTQQTELNEICSPIMVNIFSGGESGGFGNNQLSVSVCVPESFSLFVGGEGGGHSYQNFLNAIQFTNSDTIIPACEDGIAILGLNLNSTELVYRWEVSTDGGNTYATINDGTDYMGAETDELTILNVDSTLDGYVYRVYVAFPGCISAFSPLTTLDVEPQPVSGYAIKDPNVSIICQGDPVSADFSPGAYGAGNAADVYEFSINGGNDWGAYSPRTPINTASIQGISIARIRTYRSADGQGCVDSAPSEVDWTVAGEGFWVGVTSADWNTQSNWGCGVIPGITTDVTIPQVQIGNNQPNILVAPNAYARNLIIEPNASVTTFFGNTLEIHGNFINNGVASLGIGKVRLSGNTAQSIGGSSASVFGYLEIDNQSGNVELDQDITVSDELELVSGLLNLNGHNINLGSTGKLVGEDETRYIWGWPGEIQSSINLSSPSTLYSNIAGIGVSITTGAGNVPGQTIVNRGHYSYSLQTLNFGLNRYFKIEPQVNEGLDVTLRLYYLDNEISSGSHLEENLIPWRSADDGITWEGQFFPLQITANSTENWVELTGVNAFSHWTLSDWLNEPLPVELLLFEAIAGESIVDLKWITATEINNHYFTVERSSDAENFEPILRREGAGNSNYTIVYTDLDPDPLMGVSYYRLRQIDFDGSSVLSEIVPVNFGSNRSFLSAWSLSRGNIFAAYSTGRREQVSIQLFDMAGKLISSALQTSEDGKNSYTMRVNIIESGVYLLRVEGQNSGVAFSQKLFIR